jgi:hypothetical protein
VDRGSISEETCAELSREILILTDSIEVSLVVEITPFSQSKQ